MCTSDLHKQNPQFISHVDLSSLAGMVLKTIKIFKFLPSGNASFTCINVHITVSEDIGYLSRACCRNTALLTGVTSTADELTSFVYSALLLGCRVSVAEDNQAI
jgi:hypothetical protein